MWRQPPRLSSERSKRRQELVGLLEGKEKEVAA
jgi:hypothetical protein